MAFKDYTKTEIGAVEAGILNPNISYKADTYTTFEDGLVVGRFAKFDTGSLDNLDGSATPVIGGIVLRNTNNDILQGNTFTTTGDGAVNEVDGITWGLVTVDVVDGDTPAKFGTVYAVNAAGSGADFGKATTTSTDNVEVAGYFNREIKTNVWEVFIQL